MLLCWLLASCSSTGHTSFYGYVWPARKISFFRASAKTAQQHQSSITSSSHQRVTKSLTLMRHSDVAISYPKRGLTLGGEALKLLSESRSPTATSFQAIVAEVFT